MSARIFSKGLICRSHLNQHVLSWFHNRKTPKLYHLPSKQRKSRCNIYHYGNSFNPFEQYKILQVQSKTRMSKLQSSPNRDKKKTPKIPWGNHHKPRSKSEMFPPPKVHHIDPRHPTSEKAPPRSSLHTPHRLPKTCENTNIKHVKT